jgi:hypothetical protein
MTWQIGAESFRKTRFGKLPSVHFETVLRTFADFFDRAVIRYAVIGGVAVNAWGRARSTSDLDFAVDGSRRSELIPFAESLGYETMYASAAFSNHRHSDPSFGRVDFMYVSGPTADRIFAATALKPLLSGRGVPVASPEHLAMMKALAMKNFPHRTLYEGEDVRVLLSVPGVDRDAVREYFREHGLLDLYDAIEKTL